MQIRDVFISTKFQRFIKRIPKNPDFLTMKKLDICYFELKSLNKEENRKINDIIFQVQFASNCIRNIQMLSSARHF